MTTPLKRKHGHGDLRRAAIGPEYYDSVLPRYNEISKRPLLLSALRLFGKHQHVLDLGCGNGAASAALLKRGHRVTALDFSPIAVKLTSDRYPEADVRQWDLRSPIPVNGDASLMMQVLEHLEDDRGAVMQALKAAPLLVASVPNARLGGVSHVRTYDPKSLRRRFGPLGRFRIHPCPGSFLLFTLRAGAGEP